MCLNFNLVSILFHQTASLANNNRLIGHCVCPTLILYLSGISKWSPERMGTQLRSNWNHNTTQVLDICGVYVFGGIGGFLAIRELGANEGTVFSGMDGHLKEGRNRYSLLYFKMLPLICHGYTGGYQKQMLKRIQIYFFLLPKTHLINLKNIYVSCFIYICFLAHIIICQELDSIF